MVVVYGLEVVEVEVGFVKGVGGDYFVLVLVVDVVVDFFEGDGGYGDGGGFGLDDGVEVGEEGVVVGGLGDEGVGCVVVGFDYGCVDEVGFFVVEGLRGLDRVGFVSDGFGVDVVYVVYFEGDVFDGVIVFF